MKLLVNFDQNTASLPSGFVAAVNYVVGYFDSLFTNNVTVTIDVGFGEIAGQSLESGALGESEQIIGPSVSYPSVRSDLIAQGAPGSSTLPINSPAPSADTLFMASAEEKAVGLIPDNSSLDGYVGFASAANTFGYGINTAPPAGEYYFVGVVEHEFTEIMGRTSYLDLGAYSLMDLFRYAGTNTRQFTTDGPSYFSIDSGATNLNNWNNFETGNRGDLGDWAASAGNDAFDDNSNPGVINNLTQTDIRLMNALGWTLTTSPTPTPTPTPTPSPFTLPSPTSSPSPSPSPSPFIIPSPTPSPSPSPSPSPFIIPSPSPTPPPTPTPFIIPTPSPTPPPSPFAFPFPTFDNTWTLAGVGNANGGPYANLTWANQTSQAEMIQLLNGTTTLNDGPIANGPWDAGWNVAGARDFLTNGFEADPYRYVAPGTSEAQVLHDAASFGGGIAALA